MRVGVQGPEEDAAVSLVCAFSPEWLLDYWKKQHLSGYLYTWKDVPTGRMGPCGAKRRQRVHSYPDEEDEEDEEEDLELGEILMDDDAKMSQNAQTRRKVDKTITPSMSAHDRAMVEREIEFERVEKERSRLESGILEQTLKKLQKLQRETELNIEKVTQQLEYSKQRMTHF